jgi:hypothetical protein
MAEVERVRTNTKIIFLPDNELKTPNHNNLQSVDALESELKIQKELNEFKIIELNAAKSVAESESAKHTDLRVTQKQIEEVTKCIEEVLAGRKLSQSSIVRVVANCMLLTSKMKISNSVKKKVLITGVEKYIKEKSDLNEEEVDMLMALVDTVVSDAIDTIADIKSGNLKISTNCCVLL